jgi:hypothetical protein
MRRSTIFLLAVLLSAVAVALSACGADNQGRSPITTVQSATVQTNEEGQTDEDAEEEESGDDGKKGKDRGKSHGNKGEDDSE